jgi:hypothetical protein
MVMPSDHLIPDAAAFGRAASAAAKLAEDGRIVVLGITPTGPSSAYGYIAPGAPIGPGAHAVDRFVEKPDLATAETLIASGCLWNAGMFCFRADAGLREIEKHAPDTLEAVRRSIQEGSDDLGALRLGEAFLAAQKISFDHAVMEKTKAAAVVAADFAWSDIGDWKAVWEQSPRDAHGVAREGRVHTSDVTDSYLRSDGRLLCVIGVSGRRRHRLLYGVTGGIGSTRAAVHAVKSATSALERAPRQSVRYGTPALLIGRIPADDTQRSHRRAANTASSRTVPCHTRQSTQRLPGTLPPNRRGVVQALRIDGAWR